MTQYTIPKGRYKISSVIHMNDGIKTVERIATPEENEMLDQYFEYKRDADKEGERRMPYWLIFILGFMFGSTFWIGFGYAVVRFHDWKHFVE